MQIGHFSRLSYDKNAYEDKLQEGTSPISYRLNHNQIHNCKRCNNTNGSGPLATSRLGFGNSTIINTSSTPANDLVDIDSIMSNRNVKISKAKKGKLNTINLTKYKNHDYELCGNFTHPEYSRLSYPKYNYRDMAVNRFYDLIYDPQEVIFYPYSHNTQLEATDNWIPKSN